MYERFLKWIHKENKGDAQVIIGAEIIAVALVIFYKFFDSSISEILKYEKEVIYALIVLGIGVFLLAGVMVLIYGVIIKMRDKNSNK